MKHGIAILAGICALLLSSCASYQVKDAGSPPYAKIFVKPIQNNSTFPVLEATLTSSIRKAIDDTGFLSIADENASDAFLLVVVDRVQRDTLAVQADDLGRGRKFELQFELTCSLFKDAEQTAAYFSDRPLVIRQDVFADSGQVNAEFQATPEVSRKIALKIANLLTDVW